MTKTLLSVVHAAAHGGDDGATHTERGNSLAVPPAVPMTARDLEADDDRALAFVKHNGMPQQQRKELWSQRFRSNKAIQYEFQEEGCYVAFMESLVGNRAHILGKHRR